MTDPSTASPSGKPKRRKGRWKTVALVVSVALNLFVAAFVLGQATRGYFDDGRRPFDRGSPRVDWERVIDHLPHEARREAQEVFRESGDRMRSLTRELQRARDAAARAVLAEPYDQEAAREALAVVRQRTTEVQELIQEGLLRIAENLTPQERRRFFDSLPPPARP